MLSFKEMKKPSNMAQTFYYKSALMEYISMGNCYMGMEIGRKLHHCYKIHLMQQ